MKTKALTTHIKIERMKENTLPTVVYSFQPQNKWVVAKELNIFWANKPSLVTINQFF
jgi:hypothetical protein